MLLAALALLVGIAPTRADEPFSMSLLADDSLAGWDYGWPPPAGWTIAQGRLSGDQRSTPLVGGWTMGNGELRVAWNVSSGGVVRLTLLGVSSPMRYDIRLAEGDSGGAVFDGQRLLAAGGRVAAREGAHLATLRRQGTRLSLLVDDRPLWQIELPESLRCGLELAVTEGQGTIEGIWLDEPAGTPIFNGTDLTGWWTPGNLASWPVEDGELVCINKGGNYIRSDKQYGNFTLSLEYKMQRRGNSGIGIRTHPDAWPSGDGMELQLLDEPPAALLTRSSTMGIYGNLEPLARADRSERWNRAVVKAEGYLISAWINGRLVQHANTAELPELAHRRLEGWIGIQDHGNWIRVRNINVLEAPPELGLSAWYRRRPEPGSRVVLDRLMNAERLAAADGIHSGFVVAEVPDEGEHLLAELSGPGALVGIEHAGRGQLTCYIDGQDEPVFACGLNELGRHLPRVAEASGRTLTYLAYRSGLRLVVREAAGSTCRIEYVTLPSDLTAGSFLDADQGIARGMLSALSYRYQQLNGGRHRESDPYERMVTPSSTVEPGSTLPLAHVEGAGTVLWFKLRAPTSVLADDRLWLDVTIDGESQPAVSAPARFLFPGLSEGRWHNFVLTESDGPTLLLAMPFSRGFSVTARNAGSDAIDGVGLELSVRVADEASRPAVEQAWRLRGQFLPAGDASSGLVNLTGRGRWIALVYSELASDQLASDESASTELGSDEPASDEPASDEPAAAGPPRIAALRVDGQPREGWSDRPLAELWGPSIEPFRGPTSGRAGGLAWRYLLPATVEFQESLALEALPGQAAGQRLVLYYLAP